MLKGPRFKNFSSSRLNPANICWSSRQLQNVFSVAIFRLPTRLEDVLKTSRKMFCEDEDVLRTRWIHFLMYCWGTKALLGIFVPKKSKCVSNKSIFPKFASDETKSNPKRINLNPIISLFLFFETQAASLF